eukprot:4174252-Ditylum_brightwellii.AAC.1
MCHCCHHRDFIVIVAIRQPCLIRDTANTSPKTYQRTHFSPSNNSKQTQQSALKCLYRHQQDTIVPPPPPPPPWQCSAVVRR